MSGHVTDGEYRAIRQSWDRAPRGNPERWTNGQMANACHVNVQEAAKREATLRGYYETWLIGDVRRNGDKDTPSLWQQITAAVLDKAHWQRQVTYWRGRCVAEGDDAVPAPKFDVRKQPQDAVAAGEGKRTWSRDSLSTQAPVLPDSVLEAERLAREAARLVDRRMPREPGDDDEDLF